MSTYLLAIDQGTTNSRAILFTSTNQLVSQHEIPLGQSFPQPGWVEQNPEEMLSNTIACCREVLKKSRIHASQIAAIGISNQRETTIVWNKITGKPIYPAIVWQDRRTSDLCKQLSSHPICSKLQQKTGLLLDPYFSATKLVWVLENVAYAREQAEKSELLFGTVDTYLLWHLTKQKSHFTDITNASRTLFFNIHTQDWDQDILQALQIPACLLPCVLDNTAHFGNLDETILGQSIPITGMAGDQQAATVGQACFHAGMVKATYGTGGFMLLNTGAHAVLSNNKLLSTIAYRIHGQVTYGLEGSIFCAGTTIKWLRDTLKIINTAAETETIAQCTPDTNGIYLIPAFTGLGAPYWDPDARGALLGLTRNSQREHIVRAALESVAYQSRDLLQAISLDSNLPIETVRVDGGMANNNWLLQFLADILQLRIQRPACIETSALGAAYLAGLHVGIYASLEEISQLWLSNKECIPHLPATQADLLYQQWQHAVKRVLS
ncbi:MAG: glycerol kinase [Gammaproteobacteria bacterium RIFCSPHIGHO2_12_FULL_41_20]|nr:MAG: glycerol kinase [Gammaproteobacteria bacterium RIFCSPHIGHO2_12_FULL_41_20]